MIIIYYYNNYNNIIIMIFIKNHYYNRAWKRGHTWKAQTFHMSFPGLACRCNVIIFIFNFYHCYYLIIIVLVVRCASVLWLVTAQTSCQNCRPALNGWHAMCPKDRVLRDKCASLFCFFMTPHSSLSHITVWRFWYCGATVSSKSSMVASPLAYLQ